MKEATHKRYSDTKLNSFKTIINPELEKVRQEASALKTRLDELEAHASQTGGHSYGEDSKNQEQREFLTRQYVRQMEKIHALELALARIANKTYGVDQQTGALIDEDRLRAEPTATSAI